MSDPFGNIVLTLSDITQVIREVFGGFPDPRRGKNTHYKRVDAGLSAFSVVFMPSPSFLEHPRSLEQTHGENKARTLLGVHEIPTDNQIRTLRDATDPAAVRPLFSCLFNGWEQSGRVDAFRSVEGALRVAFDGTESFSSQAIHCKHCSTRRHGHGTVTYFHTALTPVVAKAGSDKVIPRAPEFVRPQEGAEKQDCELNAAKRGLDV